MLGHDLGDPWLQALHPAAGELAGEHAAQPGVPGWVQAQQVAGLGGALFFLGHLGCPGYDEPWRALIGEPLRIGEHRLDVVVAGHQVHRHAEGVDDGAHPLVLADLAEGGDGVEVDTLHVQRR